MKQLIIKLAFLIGYIGFAAVSAFFTAESLSLDAFGGTPPWSIFPFVFAVALLAGWCLTNVVKQTSNPEGKGVYVINLMGFLLFWGVSFVTNVHYLFVSKNGYVVLTEELANCKNYLNQKTTGSIRELENKREQDLAEVIMLTNAATSNLQREISNTRYLGFGTSCINILSNFEMTLNSMRQRFNDKNNYSGRIYDPVRDSGDTKGIKSYSEHNALYNKYAVRIMEQSKIMQDVIKSYYQSVHVDNAEYKAKLGTIDTAEKFLKEVGKDGSATANYSFYNEFQTKILAGLGDEYKQTLLAIDTVKTKNDDGEIVKTTKVKGYKTYPSVRMFDTVTVWGDILKGKTPDNMPLLKWIFFSLLIDIVAFVLAYKVWN